MVCVARSSMAQMFPIASSHKTAEAALPTPGRERGSGGASHSAQARRYNPFRSSLGSQRTRRLCCTNYSKRPDSAEEAGSGLLRICEKALRRQAERELGVRIPLDNMCSDVNCDSG